MTKILLVDDEPDVARALEFRLSDAGYEVLTADNALSALDVLQQAKVDLVLSDFMMPEINGLELARMVKGDANLCDTHIILFSCSSDPEFRRRAIGLGAADFLSKMDGYPSIVERVIEVAPLARQPAANAGIEAAFREQLHSLALRLVDVVHLAGAQPPHCPSRPATRWSQPSVLLTTSSE